MAIVSTTVTTTLYVTSEAFTIPKNKTKHEYKHRGLDGDMGMGLNPDPNLTLRAWEKFIHIHT